MMNSTEATDRWTQAQDMYGTSDLPCRDADPKGEAPLLLAM